MLYWVSLLQLWLLQLHLCMTLLYIVIHSAETHYDLLWEISAIMTFIMVFMLADRQTSPVGSELYQWEIWDIPAGRCELYQWEIWVMSVGDLSYVSGKYEVCQREIWVMSAGRSELCQLGDLSYISGRSELYQWEIWVISVGNLSYIIGRCEIFQLGEMSFVSGRCELCQVGRDE